MFFNILEDELASDSFPMQLVDDLIYEFKGRHVVRKEGEVTLSGANPSAEEMDEGTEEHVERGIDFVLNHRLQEMNCYEVDRGHNHIFQNRGNIDIFHDLGSRSV